MTRPVTITDHALVRWLERARGIDMEELRAALAEIAQPYADACVKHAPVDGVWFVFDGPRLITITPDKPKTASVYSNDREKTNRTHLRAGEFPWQAKKRKRDHR